jgi:HemY protein
VSIPSIPAAQPAGDDIVDVIVEDEVAQETAAVLPVPPRAVPPATDGATLTDEDDMAEPIRLPDDPGVDPEVERENAQKRFRLF